MDWNPRWPPSQDKVKHITLWGTYLKSHIFETIEPFEIKLGSNVPWIVHYKIYVCVD
jgi:hypothetical protein